MGNKEMKIKILDLYNKGLELYRNRKFTEAKEYFKKCLEIYPDDGPSKIYFDRCEVFIKEPPPENWDGVFVMTTK